jgi:hypothetical protein
MNKLVFTTFLFFLTLSSASTQVIPDWSNVPVPPWPLTTPPEIINPVLTAADVTDVVDPWFIADPFMFHEGENWYMFFEVLYYDIELATYTTVIALATSTDGLHWDYEEVVIDESGPAMSFPQVFKYDGEYYMIPADPEQIGVYVATNFPYEWTYLTTLLSLPGVPQDIFLDPAIFNYNDKWWMFVAANTNKDCHLFYSDDLLSGWVEHPLSPIVVNDRSKARPGGRPFVYDGDRVIRLAQKDDIFYGEAVRAFEVDVLTETDYAEHEIPESPISTGVPSEPWRAVGSHTADPWWTGDRWLCVVDGIDTPYWNLPNTFPEWKIGILEYVPLDTDNDSVFDIKDNCPTIPNGPDNGTCTSGANSGALCTDNATCGAGGFCSMSQEDADYDTIGDVCDNCPAVTNPGQEDTDGDEIGDVCDTCTDPDGDGYGNQRYPYNICSYDNCLYNCNTQQLDADDDNVGDVCDETAGCGGCGQDPCEQEC